MIEDAETDLRAENALLRAKFSDTQADLPAEWRLTPTEARIFRVLLAVDTATHEAIAEGAGVSAQKTQVVHISRIRPKLARRNVEIETVQTKGWRLVGRAAWQSVLSQPQTA